MKITTEIDESRNLRSHTITGSMTFDDLTGKLEEIYSSSEKLTDMNVLWDIREAEISSFSTAEIQSVVKLVSTQWGASADNKAALIVSGDLEYGLTRMYEMLLESQTASKINVFRDRNTAENWLLLEE